MPVEIAGILLHRIHRITSVEQAALVYHRVPGLEGDLVQDMGRACVRLRIEGIFYGPTAADDLEALRKVSKARQPVDFLADIVGQAYFAQVTLDHLELVQAAREPEQFSFTLVVVEYVPPPQLAATTDFAGVDAGILAEAQNFMDLATLPDTLSLPEFTDPTAPISGLLSGVETSMAPVGDVAGALTALFGTGDGGSPSIAASGTLFDQIGAGLADNDLGDRLLSQVGNLSSIGSIATGLFDNPPAAVGELIQGVMSVALPDADLGALPEAIAGLQSLVPADLGNLTGGLLAGITGLAGQADAGVTRQIAGFVSSLQALHELLQRITGGSPAGAAVRARGSLAMSAAAGDPGTEAADAETSPAVVASRAVAATATGQIDRVIQALNRLPDPLNVESLLQGLSDLLNGFKRSLFPTTHLPFTDELGQTLGTLWQWRGMDGSQIAGHLESTLQAAVTFMGHGLGRETQAITDLIDGLEGAVDSAALQGVCQSLHQELQNLAAAVTAADTTLVNDTLTTLNGLEAQLDAMLAAVMSGFFAGQSNDLGDRLEKFHARAEGCLCDLLTTINPATDTGYLATASERVNAAFSLAQVDGFVDGYRQMFDWLRDLIDQVDLSIIEGPITTAASAMQDAVDELDGLLVGVVTQTSLLFDDVEAAIDQVDTAAIAAAIEEAIQGFQQQAQARIDELFTPVRQAIATALDNVESAVGEFDPEDIIEALRQAVQTLTGILSDPQVLEAIQSIRDSLDGMVAELDDISFKPANDVVIDQIDEVKSLLQSLDTSLLNNMLKLALMAAVEILPGEDALQSVKNDLLARLDGLITSGPATLLASAQLQPERLLDLVRSYSPLVLLGDALSGPFQKLIDTLEGIKPSDLLQPVQQALTQLKTTLEQEANPGKLIAPLEAPFAQLLGLFDQLKPQELVAPLNQGISQVIDTVIEALPVDEIFEVFDAVLAHLQTVTDTVGAIRTLFQRASALLSGFEDPEAQMNAWVDGIIDRLDQVPDTTNLSAAFDQVRDAIAGLRAQPILDRVLQRLQPFMDTLTGLDAQASLTQLIRDCRDFPHHAVVDLPEPEREGVQAFFAAFDPLAQAISRPLSQLQALADQLEPMPDVITAAFAGWDATYHSPTSYLSAFVPADTSIPAVKTLLRTTIREEVAQPLTVVLRLLPNLGHLVTSFLEVFDELAADIEDKMSVLVGGPSSLTTIRQAMDALVSKIRSLNFDFLADELDEVFARVKSKLEAISPAKLREIVETTFSAILDNLDLGTLLPMEQVNGLDTLFAGLVSDLGELDPHTLVVEVVQPEFEAAIKPYLEPFDLTALLTALIEQLRRLEDDLGMELDRTIAAFVALLDAIPSLEIDIDIGVDVGGLF